MTSTPVTLITGGASGIGAATTARLLSAGHRVAVTGRDRGKLDRFAERTGAGDALVTLPGDATVYADIEAAVNTTAETFGRLDNVIANAGFNTFDSLDGGDPDGWRDMILVNVLGPALLLCCGSYP